jgi:hypothetical protein
MTSLTAAELLAPKGRTIKGFPRKRRPHAQTALEIAARDANWQRGQVLALERNMHRIVHKVAPHSDALIRVVAGMTKALLRHLEEREVSARLRLYRLRPHIAATQAFEPFGNFISRSRS